MLLLQAPPGARHAAAEFSKCRVNSARKIHHEHDSNSDYTPTCNRNDRDEETVGDVPEVIEPSFSVGSGKGAVSLFPSRLETHLGLRNG